MNNNIDGDLLTDVTEFGQLVGALQYLTMTRSEISDAVNFVCQFMQALRSLHLLAAKRILQYIKGSPQFGLSLFKCSSFLPRPDIVMLIGPGVLTLVVRLPAMLFSLVSI